MVTKKPKGLGRGLDALLGPSLSATASDSNPQPNTPAGTPMMLPLDDLRPGQYQPRTRMDEGALYELAESIKSQGIMQPILVRRLDGNRSSPPASSPLGTVNTGAHYEIIAGERRFRAARLAGLADVPVLVREVPDEAAAAMSLIENIQREDLNPLEEAQGLQRLVKEFELTHEQAAQAVGRSRSAASNLLRLLQLAEPVQTMLMAGDIDMGHARALLVLEGAAQITAANQVSARKLSVRETESLVKRLAAEFNLTASRKSSHADEKSGDVRRVEEELSDLLMAQVEVRVKKKTKRGGKLEEAGELAVQFGSLEELNGLIERLRG
ncbi:MAG: ParB/RepB/Spo0J family partition protein [Ottowia sp.]|uniref:ParB/RepB/Spo0J family partition protein n=1 Tax=Ottowia sp. TaxID=1898956 RepID=UPI003C70E834